MSVVLDQQGWQDVTVLLEKLLTSVQRIHDESAARVVESETGPAGVATEIAVLLLRRAPGHV